MNHTKQVMCAVLAGLLLSVSGCNEYAKKKQAMEEKWEASVAEKKIPLAENYIERGNISQAKETLQRCLASLPNDARVYLLIGRVQFIEDQIREARASFEKSVELDDQLDQAWYYLGSLAVLRDDLTKALMCYQKAQGLNPDNVEYRISISDVLAAAEQLDDAEAVIREGLEFDSDNLELLLTMAQLKQQAGKIEEAIAVYEQAQFLHGAQPRITEPCAYCYIALGKWSEAYDKFERLIPSLEKGTPQYNTNLRSLALCAYNSGRYDKSLDCYDELSVVYRDDSEIWLNMAQAALGADEPSRAIYCAKKSLKIHRSPSAYAVLGSGLYIEGKYEQSLDAFYKITDHEELAGFAWFMAGRCYQQLGQTVQANSAFDRAEKFDPNSELISIFLKRSVRSL